MYLVLDVESRSELDLTEVGAHRYATHPSTECILVPYAYGDEEVKIWECLDSPMPQDLKEGLEDPFQIIIGWNVLGFDRLIFRNCLGFEIPLNRWEDVMVRSRYMSMPGSLEKVGKILDIQNKKLVEFFIKDQSMISMFCEPLRMGGEITLFGEEPTTYRWKDTHKKEWDKFIEYAKMDVEATREIYKRLSKFPLPDWEYELLELSEEINDRGVYTDPVLLQGATLIVEKEQETLKKEFFELTGIKKPKSNPATLAFVRQHGYTFGSIGKAFVNRALAGECNLDDTGRKALKLRLQLSKSSVAKLESCKNSVMPDGRIRGLFNFMGASRTGRWSSGLFQIQNVIKATKEVEKKYEMALSLLRAGDYDGVKNNFSSPIDVACSALRPILRAPSGSRFIIADLSAIESRGTGWVAGCETLMDIFRQDKDCYCVFAALMDPTRTYEDFYHEFKVLKNKTNRNNAKPPFLGAGFGLGPGDITKDEEGNIVKTGLLNYAASMGIELTPEYAERAIMVYRNSYKEVCDFWYDLHRAFVNVVENDAEVELGPLRLDKEGRVLRIWLPSGRALHYINPEVQWVEKESKKGKKYKAADLYVDGIIQKTHQWGRITTRGSRLVENIVQAICRDILGCGMLKAREAGFQIVLTCHDEIVAEVSYDSSLGVEDLVKCMTTVPKWADGFLLGAEGFESPYYVKN